MAPTCAGLGLLIVISEYSYRRKSLYTSIVAGTVKLYRYKRNSVINVIVINGVGCNLFSVIRPSPHHHYQIFSMENSKLFQTGLIRETFQNRKLTSIGVVFRLDKTFFTHFDCDYVQINCFFL